MSTAESKNPEFQPLSGITLWSVAIFLSTANFISTLDITVANVSVPTIAGGLGATTSQGTWVITSYAVAEAITVPLTGWLATRFGAVRVFVWSMALFGLFSGLCGLANSLEWLVLARVLQGLAGGPLVPLSQTLLLRVFPKEKATVALGLWAMTTMLGPVMGPMFGGWLCDNYSWPWIFFVNLPFALAGAVVTWNLIKSYENPVERYPIDKVGLILLVVWVGALQLMFDKGKDLDWFESKVIISMAIVAAIGFVAFVIWELAEEHPVVDLRVFRHIGFTAGVATISLGFAGLYGNNMLVPLWLQSNMGYNASAAGMGNAWTGLFAVLAAPFAVALSTRLDSRALVFGGLAWMALITMVRSYATTDMSYWQIMVPLMLMGLGLPFFIILSTSLTVASVTEEETASAAGLMNFMRTVAGAFATSLVNTAWENRIVTNHAELAGQIDGDHTLARLLESAGMADDMARALFDQVLTGQSIILATNQVQMMMGLVFLAGAIAIWLAPKPARYVDPTQVGH